MKAYPKLNLDLAIVAIDERGYHLLDSVMISLKTPFDMIAAKLGERLSLSIRGVSSLSETDNLIITAVHRICDYLNIDIPPLNFILEKRIPIGAGLGGGSSDAAAAIWITLDYLGIQIPELELLSLASKIGSDVPFCLMRQPALVGGAGQSQLEYLKKPQEQLWIVLVNPLIEINTKQVFMIFDKMLEDGEIAFSDHDQSYRRNLWHSGLWREALLVGKNDLTPAAVRLNSEIGYLLNYMSELDGVICARMSGSGSSCFAVAARKADAANIYLKLVGRYPNYFITKSSAL